MVNSSPAETLPEVLRRPQSKLIREHSQKPPRRRDLYNSLRFIPLNDGQMVRRRTEVGVVECQILRGIMKTALAEHRLLTVP